MNYSRTAGGEKNDKSGVKWTKPELEEVYHVFAELGGKGLHERNPKIIELAERLGRTVRSVEAQTLMFRNLARGGDYSHGNMNKLSKQIWDKMEINNQNDFKKFPEGLLDWAGHKRGGVKKPFDKNSGRPNGEVIQTQLTRKIDDWISSDKQERPSVLLLVGGPGNGKTDALEYLINQVDSMFGTSYFDEIEQVLKDSSGIVPRTISIELNNQFFTQKRLDIVQDASTGQGGKSSQECLIHDLESALHDDKIYIACINRGILAEAVSLSQTKKSPVYNVLNKVIIGITENIQPIPLWPLQIDGYNGQIAVWPMDVESLVQQSGPIEKIPAYQIISNALDEKKWNCDSCTQDKNLCPFYQNRRTLIDEDKLQGLLQLLHDYEMISNNRWTFRELFSLISYMLVGSEHEFGSKSPCEWVESKITDSKSNDSKARVRAVWELNDHLYHFRLFNHWPTFSPIARSTSSEISNIFKCSPLTKEFFGYFSYVRNRRDYKPDISLIIDGDFYHNIDPGQANIVTVKTRELPVHDIEASFSYSVQSGRELAEDYLNPLELRLIKQLALIEKELDNQVRFESSVSSAKVDDLLVLLRMVATRFFKRIYFSGLGISKDEEYLNAYRELNIESDINLSKLKEAKRLFDGLIQNSSELTVVLNSSIAQPQLTNDLKVKLKVNRVQIKHKYIDDELKDVPRTKLKLFTIVFGEKLNIPLSYQLYKALCQLDAGVRNASLPQEVLALIDNIKSKIAGKLVRDQNLLLNSRIEIGDSDLNYRIDELDETIEISTQKRNL